jgi:hypothetical protein
LKIDAIQDWIASSCSMEQRIMECLHMASLQFV